MTTDPTGTPDDVQATFCATLVDEWVRAGMAHAVVCPGSRSTPLALALARDGRVRVHVFHDERAGSFAALGLGRASGRPAAVVTTSGTAAVECHAAVVEADLSGVPMLVVTADRPRELWGTGAPQTITQEGLFGSSVRWSHSPGVPHLDGAEPAWRSLASRAVLAACGLPPGPVHLDLELREPLVGQSGPLPAGRPDGRPWHTSAEPARLPALGDGSTLTDVERGVIVAGGHPVDHEAVSALAAAVGWPVLADPRSGARVPGPVTVSTFDALLRSPGFAERQRPDLVLQLGPPPASRVLAEWVAGASARGAEHVVVDPTGRWLDPSRRASGAVRADPAEVCRRLAESVLDGARGASGWMLDWQRAERAARSALDGRLLAQPVATEPGLAAAVTRSLPDGATLVVASSMPVRDVEWYSQPRHGVRIVANRGANGIDGVVSSAIGHALAGEPTVALVGDVAFLHDSTALIGLDQRPVDLTVVVVDNDGGGIFSFLPQARTLDPLTFELLFGTPHGVDVAALAAAHGVEVVDAGRSIPEDLAALFETPGARVVRVATSRSANVDDHDELHGAVAEALAKEGLDA